MNRVILKRFVGLLACASALAGPAHAAASSASLEDAFDTTFAARPASQNSAPQNPVRQAPARATPVRPSFSAGVVPLVYAQPSQQVYSTPLEMSIAALADGTHGRIGVAAYDLTTGRSVAILGNQPFPMASTSKVAIVATYLAAVDAGRLTLDQSFALRIPVPSKKFDGDEAPVRNGTMMPAYALIEAAITHSDNHATDALLAAVGGPAAVTLWVQQNTGIGDFHLDRTIATLVRDDGAINPATMIDRRDSISPQSMVYLLSGLYRGQWLSPQSRDVLMGAMSRTVTGKHRIRALMPEDVKVAHKTGTLSNTASDVGFIRGPDGHDIALAIYVTGQGGKASRDARIASIARALYDGYQIEQPGQFRTALH